MRLPYREMNTESEKGERGYPWLFFSTGRSWLTGLLVTLLILGLSAGFFFWYAHHSRDLSPDSIAGYAYAIAGTVCLVLAATLYSIRRRSRKRAIGKLNAALNWHVFLGIIGLALLFMHSFGNFNPRTGTYALYGMIALVISGFIGRTLDRIMPRLIASEVRKALTAQGDDRIESISQKLQAIVVHNSEQVQAFSTSAAPANRDRSMVPLQGQNAAMAKLPLPFEPSKQSLITPWDLAYISLEATPQELSAEAPQYRFIPDKKSNLARPGALLPGAQEHISELERVQQALRREQFYRYVIRYWRVFHVALALLTIGLTVWHLVYAAQLLIPTFLH
jgi:hypothetical protein